MARHLSIQNPSLVAVGSYWKTGHFVHFNLPWAGLGAPVSHRKSDLTHPQLLDVLHRRNHSKNIATYLDLLARLTRREHITKSTHLCSLLGVGLMSHNDLTDVDPMAQGWPFSVAEDHFKASEASIAVDTASPRTYNLVNDRRGGDILSKQQIRVKRGSGGVQIGVKCGMLPSASD